MNADEIIACSRCHCRHRAEDFGANRLGERWKTCVACRTPLVDPTGLTLKYPETFRRRRLGIAISVMTGSRDRIGRITNGLVFPSVGISQEGYADYLENLFQPGMTWFNHGTANIHTRAMWQVDHIKPIGVAGLTMAEYRARGHYTNTRPIWHDDHAAKSTIDRGDARTARAALAAADVAPPPVNAAPPTPLTDADVDAILLDALG